METRRQTAGESFDLRCEITSLDPLLEECTIAAAGELPSMSIEIQAERTPFDTAGWDVLTPAARYRGDAVVLRDVCTAGFDLQVRIGGSRPSFVLRRHPSAKSRLGKLAPARARLLLRAALLQFPAMWNAGVHGRAPLHASVVSAGDETILLVGASGVGKSTLVDLELAAGGRATSDNLVLAISSGMQ